MQESDLLADLNDAQREAVTHVDGPLLILAGAGSGKTRVITRRVAHLLHLGIHPASILAITFTNKAAGEMQQRIRELVPGHKLWVSTFHTMGARLLHQYADRLGLDRNFSIYDQTDRLRVVKLACENAAIPTARISPDSVMNAISKAKNQLQSPEKFAARARDFFDVTVAKVYPAYEQLLRDFNAMDFDDLLYWPALALKNDAELRRELDERFRYILVDEYQDTNLAQYQIIRHLAVDYPNLCVVGDPDQSIYSFRGSDIQNILNFERDFPGARTMTLSLNYRSTRSILDAASGLIAHNINRKPKDLLTENDRGLKVNVVHYVDGVTEADGVVRMIKEMVKAKKRNYRDVAILVRINALTRELEQAMVQHAVPFQIVKGLTFFARKEIKDVLGYARLLTNPNDNAAFERAVNEPPRGIGDVTMKHLRNYADRNDIGMLHACYQVEFIPELKGRAVKAVAEFARLMRELEEYREAQPDELIRQILERSGIHKMLKESSDEEDKRRLENVEELITAAKQFTQTDANATIRDFLENVTLSSDVDGYDEEQDRVAIMTMHAAKGLEFPVVFLISLEMGILPHQRSLSENKPGEIEEERRLMFVGMTRAREELYLTLARKIRQFRGQENYPIPSLFLNEIPPDVLNHIDYAGVGVPGTTDRFRSGGRAATEGWTDAGFEAIPLPSKPRPNDPYRVGALVREPRYGVGTIIDITGSGATRTVKIRFPKHGTASFRIDKAQLEVFG